MKVLLINNCHYRRGGSESVYFGTADLLLKAGHEVVFFSLEDKRNFCTDQPEYFVRKAKSCRKKISFYFNNKDAARLMEEVIIKEKPDIAHSHLMWGGATASIIPVLHKYKIPIIHTVHDYRMVCPAYTFRNGHGEVCEKCKGNHFINCLRNKCSKGNFIKSALMTAEIYYRNRVWHPAKTLDGLIYVSSFAKQKHEEIDTLFKDTFNIVLYNYTDVGQRFPLKEDNGGYYLYYGRLSGEKGVETLIKAFEKLPELRLKVVGTGPIEDSLRKRNLPNVEFLGYKGGDILFNLVDNAKYVCVPSEWYENNPMTIVESLSMGVPIIGARIGGIPEVVRDDETGYLFESGDINSLVSTLEKTNCLPDSSYYRMKRQARAFAEKYFNDEHYSDCLINFYQEVLNRYHK